MTITEPVSLRDIADRLGVTPGAVRNWRQRHQDFPAPRFSVGGGRSDGAGRLDVWEWGHVARWAKSRGRAEVSA